MSGKVTLKDIANEVGLSPTSVSLVLNDRPCKVSAANKTRIKEVARRKRYVPNQIARSLVMQRTDTLGLIVPNIESRFFSSLASSLERRCREHGYALFITNSESTESDSELVRLLMNRGVDGLFIVVSDELTSDAGLVGKPDLYRVAVEALLARDACQHGGEVFLNASTAPSAWAWCFGRAESLR